VPEGMESEDDRAEPVRRQVSRVALLGSDDEIGLRPGGRSRDVSRRGSHAGG
jgi:hypothetical protein